eukprot:gene33228-40202_t
MPIDISIRDVPKHLAVGALGGSLVFAGCKMYVIFKDGYQKSKDSWFPGIMGITSGTLFFFVPLPHGTFGSIMNSTSSSYSGSKTLIPLIDQQVYNGVCGLVGAAGATFLVDDEPEKTLVTRSLGGFLVGFAAWMFLPRSFTCAWDNRATSCWDVLWITLNASFVTAVANHVCLSMRRLFRVGADRHDVGSVTFKWHPEGNFLASAGRNGIVHITDRHGDKVDEISLSSSAPVLGLEWDRDGEYLAILQEGSGIVPLWSISSRRVV